MAYLTPYARPVLQIHPDIFTLDWFAEGCAGCPIFHELGHYGHWRFLRDQAYLRMAKRTLTPAQKLIAGEVSEAATEDPCEFVAETFAGLAAGHQYSAAVSSLYAHLGGPQPIQPKS